MRNTTKLAGAAGITWAAANATLGFSTGEPPELDASGTEIATYLADSRGLYLAALAVFAATLPLLFVFAGELRRRADGNRSGTAASMHSPALATLVTGTTISYALLVPFLFGDGLGIDATDGILRYAYVLTFVMSLFGNIGGAALLAAASAGQSGKARTATLTVAALVGATAVGGLISADLAMIGGLGFLVIAAWSLVVGIGMVREPVRMVRTTTLVAD